MGGIQFLTDEKRRKTAAVIDLKVHKALWAREFEIPVAEVTAIKAIRPWHSLSNHVELIA